MLALGRRRCLLELSDGSLFVCNLLLALVVDVDSVGAINSDTVGRLVGCSVCEGLGSVNTSTVWEL